MKKIISVITTLVMLASLVPQMVSAATPESGTLNETVGYTFDSETKTLTITGTGAMPDYSGNSDDSRPWDSDANIERVIISEGITTIGNGAFGDMIELRYVTIPESVTKIGDRAFQSSYMIQSMGFAKDAKVTYIGTYALGWSQQFTYITIPESVTSIGYSMFEGQNNIKKIIIPGENTPLPDNFIFPAGCKFYVKENSLAYETVVSNEWDYEIITAAGNTGDKNFQWYITDSGELNVIGYEYMKDYSASDPAPWTEYSDIITSIVYGDRNSLYQPYNVGAYAFSGLTNADEITFNCNTVTEIGESAFSNTPVNTVSLSDKITKVGANAFDSAATVVARGIETDVAQSAVGADTTVYCYPDSTWKTAFPDALDIKTFKVLGIGNSFTRDATEYLYNISEQALGEEAAYTDIVIGRAYRGGEDIFGHWYLINGTEDKTNSIWTYNTFSAFGTTGKEVYIDKALSDQDWDYIWFQGYYNNTNPDRNEVVGSFGQDDYALKGIVDYVKEKVPDAKTAYYLVWPRNCDYLDNDPENINNVSTSAEMYEKLITKANQVMELTGSDGEKLFDYMLPVGTAIENARTSALNNINYEPDTATKYTNLQSDGVHLNPVGCTIASMAIFRTLTEGKSIDNITFKPTEQYLDEYLDMAKEAANNAYLYPTVTTEASAANKYDPLDVLDTNDYMDVLCDYINNNDDVLVPFQASNEVKIQKVTEYVNAKAQEDPDEILAGADLNYSVGYDEAQQQYYIISNVGYQTIKKYFDVNIVEDIDPEITALDKAMEVVTDGLIPLEANSTWESNSSTQEERTAAVQKYIDAYLVGDLSSLTAEATYNNGSYDVEFTNARGLKQTKTLSNMEFVYTLEAANETFDGYADINDLSTTFKIDNPYESYYDAQNGELTIKSQVNIRNQVIGSVNQFEFNDGSINDAYIYEVRFRVNDYLDPEVIDDTHYSAGTRIANGLYDVLFTVEKDGIYYKAADGWNMISREGDNEYHTYKVIAKEGGYVSLFVDSIKLLDYNAPIITSPDYWSTDIVSLGYKAGDKTSTTETTPASMTVDSLNLKNIYENEVFKLDVSVDPSKDGRNNLFGFTPGTVSTKTIPYYSYEFTGWEATEDTYVYVKLPKNTYITNVKAFGSDTAYYQDNLSLPDTEIRLYRYGYGNKTPESVLENAGVNVSNNILRTVMWTDVWGQRFTLKNKDAIEAGNYNMVLVRVQAPRADGKGVALLQDLEIEYKYFYDTEDEIIIADDMEYQTPGDYEEVPGVPGYYGYQTITNNNVTAYDWQFDSNYFPLSPDNLTDTVEWYGNNNSRWAYRPNDQFNGVMLYTWFGPTATISITKHNKPDFGPNYTLSADFLFNKERALEDPHADKGDFITYVNNDGYKLWFTPCVNTSEIRYLEYRLFGDTWSTAYAYADLPAEIQDKVWHEYKAVVNGDQATLYFDGVEVVTYTMPPMTAEDVETMSFSAQSDKENNGQYKVALKDVLVTRPAGQTEPADEYIEGITEAGAQAAYDGANVTITFNENVTGQAFNAYIAVYNENDKLIAVDAEDIAMTIDGTDVLSVPYTEGQKLKVLFWNEQMTPVLDMLTK